MIISDRWNFPWLLSWFTYSIPRISQNLGTTFTKNQGYHGDIIGSVIFPIFPRWLLSSPSFLILSNPIEDPMKFHGNLHLLGSQKDHPPLASRWELVRQLIHLESSEKRCWRWTSATENGDVKMSQKPAPTQSVQNLSRRFHTVHRLMLREFAENSAPKMEMSLLGKSLYVAPTRSPGNVDTSDTAQPTAETRFPRHDVFRWSSPSQWSHSTSWKSRQKIPIKADLKAMVNCHEIPKSPWIPREFSHVLRLWDARVMGRLRDPCGRSFFGDPKARVNWGILESTLYLGCVDLFNLMLNMWI